MQKMALNNQNRPIIDPGVCRCCGATKRCRLLNAEYEFCGQKEIYSDMFVDCFGLMLSNLDGEELDRLICATCVARLREANCFRSQVLTCEKELLQSTIHVHHGHDADIYSEVKSDIVKLEDIESTHLEMIKVDNYNHNEDCEADQGADHVNDDSNSIKSESETPLNLLVTQKKKANIGEQRKLKKKSIVNRTRKSKKKDKKNTSKVKLYAETTKTAPVLTRMIDNENKSFRNTVTIVENSYVCPFDTTFSDYFCIYCRRNFTDPVELREHTLIHDPIDYKDSISNKKFPQIDVHRIDCRHCDKRIDDIDVLKSHLTNVHGKFFYNTVGCEFLKFRLTLINLTCTECHSIFSFFHALKKHMAEHFGPCICDVCGAHYFEERMLILHQKTHQKIEENFPCKDCGQNFKSKHSRYLHEARKHKKEPAYQCSKCDEKLFSYILRHRHMIEVHGEKRVYPCDRCDREYDSRKSLREHLRRFHLKVLKHQCDLCEKRFYLPSRLKEHITATHTGERNFRCEYCGKSYPRLRGLKVHMQSHSVEKKYKCVICNAAFTQNVNLKSHMKRQHYGLGMEEEFKNCE